jgi:hypothetical protein
VTCSVQHVVRDSGIELLQQASQHQLFCASIPSEQLMCVFVQYASALDADRVSARMIAQQQFVELQQQQFIALHVLHPTKSGNPNQELTQGS